LTECSYNDLLSHVILDYPVVIKAKMIILYFV
jgi:hypothetical protein